MDQPNDLSIVVYVPNMVTSQEFPSTCSVQHFQPLIAYETDLMKPVVKALEKQMDIYIQELKDLEKPKDPKHMLAMVEFEDVENKVEKKRGRKGKTTVVGPISVCFEHPDQYFDNDIQSVLATRLATRPAPNFSADERLMNWKMHLRKRIDERYDA
ncbi:hypothetical protein L195_g034760, partial [Trifolium pratense]